MPLFAVQYTYAHEKSAERDDHRTDHRAWLADLVRRGIVHSSGPFADGGGALMMVEAATAADVEALFDQDPFAKRSLVENRVVREWIPVFGVFVK
ncbi:YciI family protein [Rhodococcus sp. (in: high G+C Gram-positive bacteria)]|uniref:YciI family protein n=1 Tax=Rhodococcus sp. TaxID=1831 RepID=UPI003B8A73A3